MTAATATRPPHYWTHEFHYSDFTRSKGMPTFSVEASELCGCLTPHAPLPQGGRGFLMQSHRTGRTVTWRYVGCAGDEDDLTAWIYESADVPGVRTVIFND